MELIEPAPDTLIDWNNSNADGQTSSEVTDANLIAATEPEMLTALLEMSVRTNRGVSGNGPDLVTKNPLTNNLVWLKTVDAQTKAQVSLTYRISWTEDRNIQVS